MVATENLSDRAVAYDIPGVLVDGQAAKLENGYRAWTVGSAAGPGVRTRRSGKVRLLQV